MSCIMQFPSTAAAAPASTSLLLKRMRSASPATAAANSTSTSVSAGSAAADKDSSAGDLKVCKRQFGSSPRSAAASEAVAILSSRQRPSLSPLVFESKKRAPAALRRGASWPIVKSCDGVRNALTFLQTSRRHAMMLMVQNHWERAVGVLEKIERATESVSAQRRKVVLQQANAQLSSGLAAQIDDLGLSDDELAAAAAAPEPVPTRRQRSVRFSEHVSVAVADEMDRASPEASAPVREEMFVLRASRSIPQENYSEFW